MSLLISIIISQTISSSSLSQAQQLHLSQRGLCSLNTTLFIKVLRPNINQY